MSISLVTGGAGFVGSNLVRRLVQLGHRVRVLDNLSTGSETNLLRLDVDFVEGDIRDLDTLRSIMHNVDLVFHQAALPSVQRSIEDPVATHHVNATGTLNVLIAASEAAVKRVVYASSSSVYGDSPVLPKGEAMQTAPRSPYAAAKLAGEHYCRAFADIGKIETVSLRYFNVYGPRQDPLGAYAAVIPLFIAAVLKGEPPIIHGDGTQTRDFTFIENVVNANVLAAEASSQAVGEWMNVACGSQVSLLALLELLLEITGAEHVAPIHEDRRSGDVWDSLADISKARQLIGYEPSVDLRAGLEATVDWFSKASPAAPSSV
jgi:nucleoside-diphosphate-sugar epimerase